MHLNVAAVTEIQCDHIEGMGQVCAPGHQFQRQPEDLLQAEFGRRQYKFSSQKTLFIRLNVGMF